MDALEAKSKALNRVNVGDVCKIQNHHTGQFPKRWDKTGDVVQVNKYDLYLLKILESGRLTLHNRKYLRQICLFQPDISSFPPSSHHVQDKIPEKEIHVVHSAPPSFNLTTFKDSTPTAADTSPLIKAVEPLANTSENTASYKHLELMDAAQKMVQIQDSCNSPGSDQRGSN